MKWMMYLDSMGHADKIKVGESAQVGISHRAFGPSAFLKQGSCT